MAFLLLVEFWKESKAKHLQKSNPQTDSTDCMTLKISVSNDFHHFWYNWLELRSFLLWKLHLVSCLGHLFEPFKCLNVVYRSSVSAVYAICWKELNYCAMFKEAGVLIFTANLMLMIEFETFLNFKTFCCISLSTSWVMYYDVMMCIPFFKKSPLVFSWIRMPWSEKLFTKHKVCNNLTFLH